MKRHIKTGLILLGALMLGGCMTLGGNGIVRPDVQSGYVAVGQTNSSEMAAVQEQIEALLNDNSGAAERQLGWKQLLTAYRSRDGRFEIAVLTALAMDQLEAGQRYAFLDTAAQIRDHIDEDAMLMHETEMVLAVAQAMDTGAQRPYNPVRDKGRITRVVEDLLGM